MESINMSIDEITDKIECLNINKVEDIEDNEDNEKDKEITNKLKDLLEPQRDHKKEILKLNTIKDAHIYCKINNLSGPMTGPLIEYYIKEKCIMKKNNAKDCIGDCKDRFMEDNEIKASGGGKGHDMFNYVQLRSNHKLDNYILTAYYLTYDNYMNGGELFLFKIKKNDISPLIFKYGGYAHGSKSKLGEITLEDIKDINNSKEYALRPKYDSPLWKELLEYRVSESDL